MCRGNAGAEASGIESLPLPFSTEKAAEAAQTAKAKLEKASEAFEQSDFLRELRERSDLNREK